MQRSTFYIPNWKSIMIYYSKKDTDNNPKFQNLKEFNFNGIVNYIWKLITDELLIKLKIFILILK